MLNDAIPHPIGDDSDALLAAADRALQALLAGRDLEEVEAESLFGGLVRGLLDDTAIATMLTALKLKGEAESELIGAARALRAADVDFPRPDYLFADCCGTGGDSSGSINVSTAVAFVAAAAGLPVAKHGNRSISSRCGSADVLEQLGADLDLAPEQSRRVLDETGFCFLFAPQYHPGLRYAAPVRRRLGVRTIMNLLGPCLNPAEPAVQLLGVADPARLDRIAATLKALGLREALVVHGAGLDEVALHGPTEAIRLTRGEAERLVITPPDAGLDPAPIARRGGSPVENAERLKHLLEGKAPRAEADLVAINAGALLWTAGVAPTLRSGTAMARVEIASGAPARKLAAYVEASRG